ncbi:MAG: C10 family peptidase [Bacteroidales bacterium]|nr:C10 family peptidase [Bacteroidales bacterium]
MKRLQLIITFATLLSLPIATRADRVPEQKARQIAESFLRMQAFPVTTPATRGHEAPEFYIYSAPLANSFVIISGDDVLPPVLAYSRESAFPEKELPGNLRWWLDEMSRGIDYLREKGEKKSPTVASKWTLTRSLSVEPKAVLSMETAKWDQWDPYNLLCPLIEGKQAVTGCVATSFAIILRYHKWPDKGVGTASGYTCSNLTIPDLPLGHEYDWENMPLVYDKNSTPEQKAAVSRLMYDLGVLAQAEYNVDGTSASTTTLLYGIQDHMKINQSAMFHISDNYSSGTWIEMLQRELRENGPVSYDGDAEIGGGHAFVIDGYDDQDNFHINWGWGGNSNGYFTMPDFGAFTRNQGAIFGIKKDDGSKLPEGVLLSEPGIFSFPDVPIVQGRTVNAGISAVYSIDTETARGLVSLGIADKDYHLKELLGEPFEVTLELYEKKMFPPQTIEIQGEISHGDRLMVFFKGEHNGEWMPLGNYLRRRNSIAQFMRAVYEILLSDPDLLEEASFSFNAKDNLLIIKLPQEATWTLTRQGKEVKSGKSDSLEASISLAGLENGDYVLSLLGETGAKSSVTLTL